MVTKDEKRLLLSIKIIPFIILLIIAVVGIFIALYINKVNFDKDIDNLRTKYISNEKKVIEQEVLKVYRNIKSEKQLTEEKLKLNIKEKVTNAYLIMNSIYEKNKEKSKQEILEMVTNTLRTVRFNDDRGYFFIYSMDGTALLLPPTKHLEGKNFLDLKDVKGSYTVKDMRDLTLKHGESFYTWWWYKPSEKETQSKKIGFGKYFEPLDCFVGTGEYVVDFEESIKTFLTKRLSLYSYGKNYYLFIFDKNGKILSHKDKSIVGKQSLVYSQMKDKDLLKSLNNVEENKGIFYQYLYSKNENNKKIDKISFLLPYKQWDWTIGSGFHMEDLNEIIHNKKEELTQKNNMKIKNIIIVAFVVIVIVIGLSFLLSYEIEKRFKNYKARVKEKDQLLFQQSKMAAMGEMIENIAHQWRQPLSIINTASTGLKIQKEYDMMSDEVLHKGLDNISESAVYLSETIDDFRNFYKEDKVKKTFNVSQTIQKAIDLLQSRFKKNNIELILETNNIEHYGLQNEMIQVFMNLLNNARDVLEHIELERKLIFINVTQENNHIKISFYDNGNGVDKKIINKLFDHKFTTKAKENGTGIGLYMSKLILEKSNGSIIVKNKKYKYDEKTYIGAEFIITLIS